MNAQIPVFHWSGTHKAWIIPYIGIRTINIRLSQLTCLYQFDLVIGVSKILAFFKTPSVPIIGWGSRSMDLIAELMLLLWTKQIMVKVESIRRGVRFIPYYSSSQQLYRCQVPPSFYPIRKLISHYNRNRTMRISCRWDSLCFFVLSA